MPPPYIIDASIWINVWRTHPPDIYVNVWQRLDEAIGNGILLSPEEVRHELERGTDNLAEFLLQRAGLFVPLDAAQMAAVGEVQAQCPLAADEGERNRADAFVVALARTSNGTVVTREHSRRDANARHKIPDACQHFGVPCRGWFDFLREVGWQLWTRVGQVTASRGHRPRVRSWIARSWRMVSRSLSRPIACFARMSVSIARIRHGPPGSWISTLWARTWS